MRPSLLPTVLVSGTVGSGKSAIADEIAILLHEQGIRHALLDLDFLCVASPATDDQYGEELMLKNLAAVWPNFRALRIDYLVLARVIEDRDHLARYMEAIPEADIKVVRVHAPSKLVQKRLRQREVGSFYDHLWQRSQDLSTISIELRWRTSQYRMMNGR
jgi:dephospho-CoA kinase